MKSEITGPALLYLGGKFRLSEWITSFFPPHKTYVEPFSGAASILFDKPRSKMEIINDLNGELTVFFRVIRDSPEELHKQLLLTPFSRDEYEAVYIPGDFSDLETARRVAVRSWLGIGSNSICSKSGFRNYAKDYTYVPSGFSKFMDSVYVFAERLKNVIIENRPAIEVIERYSEKDTLYYLDPPYMKNTRTSNQRYAFEMDESEHERLLNVIIKKPGKYIISGYDCDLYNDILKSFSRQEKKSQTFLQTERTEVLWISPGCEEPWLFDSFQQETQNNKSL